MKSKNFVIYNAVWQCTSRSHHLACFVTNFLAIRLILSHSGLHYQLLFIVDEIPSHRKSNLKWKLTKTKELIELFEDARTHTHARTGLAGAKMRFSVAPISNRRFPRRYVAIRSPAPDLFATQRAQPVVISKTNSPNFAQLMVVHCWRLRCVEHII